MFSQYAGPVALVILACLVGVNCGDNPGSSSDSILDRCDYNVNGFILDRLDDNRVVMIGDHGHSLYFYKRTVTHFLQYWLDQIEAGNGKAPRRLFLILESDSLKAKKAGRSMTRRGTEAYLTVEDLISPSFSLGSVQFTSEDLSGIRNRVARLNAGSSLGDSVCFEIVGPERPIDIGDWDELRRDSFFVYERDEYSYSYVARLLRANPDYKALVFYGATHLHRGRVQKQTGTIADSGYYLAHYLTEDSLIDGVYTILQTYAAKPDIRIHESLVAPDSSYAISSKFVDIQVKTGNLRSTYSIKEFDGAIVHFDRPVRNRVLLEVWSEAMAGRIMEPMCDFSDSNNYFCRMIWRRSENYLRTISGLAFPSDSAAFAKQRYRCDHWLEWYADAQLDLVEDIVSLRL